jgi:hypothetical protein
MDDAKLKNIEYAKRELPRWLSDPYLEGKFVVIHCEKVQHYYDTFQEALRFAVNNFPHNEFAIQHVIDESKIINFLSPAN